MGFKDANEFYSMSTPVDVPLFFCKDGYYRLAADMTCKGCGKRFPQVVRCDRFRTPAGIEMKVRMPDPLDEVVVAKIMLSACDHGVGCANRDNFHGPMMEPNVPGLKYAPNLHTASCWVGQVKRTGPMVLAGMESGIGVRNRQAE